jgi:NDP-sugar pyrophosphorylase family protein
MKFCILCGGYGTRIRDVAENIPKPRIPIEEYPILWHIMKYHATGKFLSSILLPTNGRIKGMHAEEGIVNFKKNWKVNRELE